MRRLRCKSYRRASRPSGRLFIPIGGGGCPSRNPLRSPPAPWRAPSGTSSPPAARDHLHVCGEQRSERQSVPPRQESSPRVRGAVETQPVDDDAAGIIPACAGSSCRNGIPCATSRDHPRACGEQEMSRGLMKSPDGSSPRVRGAVRDCIPGLRRQEIIPARAGSSRRRCRCPRRPWDHPRACGEQFTILSLFAFAAGSSPRVRGTGIFIYFVYIYFGIIPARAGSSVPRSGPCRPGGDHPRVRGEQPLVLTMPSLFEGSSPRMRGAAVHRRTANLVPGIIPAHAGSSCRHLESRGTGRDHPRACGEQSRSHSAIFWL